MAKRKCSERKERKTEFGIYLTQLRLKLDRTQQEIADSIQVSRSCICRMENGERAQKSPRGTKLSYIAAAYGVSIEDIQKKANWPQLILPLDITAEEMRELIQHLEKIRATKTRHHQNK